MSTTNTEKRKQVRQGPWVKTLRMSDEEWQAWGVAATAAGISRSELIRVSVRDALSVMRARQSADNANPGPSDLSSNEAQRSGSEGRRGGEAKGCGDESPAKLGGDAKHPRRQRAC
jgi:hypothetical protein